MEAKSSIEQDPQLAIEKTENKSNQENPIKDRRKVIRSEHKR